MPKGSGVSGGEYYTVSVDTKDVIEICFNKTLAPTGLWRAQSPLMSALPVLVMRMLIAMICSRICVLALKPLHQPRIVAEILGGAAFGVFVQYYATLFPLSSTMTLETLGNLALVYYMFLVGLELDFKPVIRVGKKALSIVLVGMLFSFLVGWVLHRYLLFRDFSQQTKIMGAVEGPFFWGITLATTNFPDIARILADLKLFNSDVGELALSASVISDLCSWFLLLLGMTVISHNQILIVVGSTLAFVGLCVFLVRPALVRVIDRRRSEPENNNYDELTCFVMAGVVLCGFITDACGTHSIVGPFVFGAIIPKGEFSNILIQKLGYSVHAILMPLFYLITGMRVHFESILNTGDRTMEAKSGTSIGRVAGVMIIAFLAKIGSTFVAGLINKMSLRDSLALGVLMNTKGVLALIILNSARDLKALNRQTYTIMITVVWIMTFVVGPFLARVYKSSARPSVKYNRRNIQSVGTKTELRILACTHTSRNVSGIIHLLDASNPTKQSPLHILAVQLVELTGHASAMLVVHDACRSSSINDVYSVGDSSPSGTFELYAQHREGVVSVQALTAVSAYATMHEDVCNLAEKNRVALIIIPFQKQYSTAVDEAIQGSDDSPLRSLNYNLIANARCSVGIFVDRGLGTSNYSNCRHHFAMLFIGGVDDREALEYAKRMAGHPKVSLTVTRFNISKKAAEVCSDDNINDGILDAMISTGKQKKLDDVYMDEFRLMSMTDASVKLLEKRVTTWEQTLTLINAMEGDYDMFIVGRRHGSTSVVTSMLLDCNNQSDELGVLGNALVSSTFVASTSILIVQHGTDSGPDSGM